MSESITLEEVWKLFQENAALQKESDRQFRELKAEAERRLQETERLLRESSDRVDRKLTDLARQIGNLTGKWGLFVENLVAPACVRLFSERGIPVQEVHQRVRRRLEDGCTMEIDLLVVDHDVVVLVEVKSTLTAQDVKEHLQRIADFKAFFPHYAGCRVMGAVAGIVSEDKAETYAYNQGLFVIVQSGESVVLGNPADFQPRVW